MRNSGISPPSLSPDLPSSCWVTLLLLRGCGGYDGRVTHLHAAEENDLHALERSSGILIQGCEVLPDSIPTHAKLGRGGVLRNYGRCPHRSALLLRLYEVDVPCPSRGFESFRVNFNGPVSAPASHDDEVGVVDSLGHHQFRLHSERQRHSQYRFSTNFILSNHFNCI